MTSVHVLSKTGKPLMPTIRFGRVRHLLKSGQAVIVKHEPFTIQLIYDTPEAVQPVEVCVDAGYAHIGVSVKSEKREYNSAQYDLLPDEKKRHDKCRTYRRTRRNRLRYRAPRFNNRYIPKGWFAPSIRNKYECHLRIIERLAETTPVTRIVIETAQFDTQLLEAIEQGLPIPEGTDYQHGYRYGIETLREAVFMRDKHICQVCEKGMADGRILRVHHALFWKGRHADRLSELMTVCTKCHTAANHQPDGKLWGLEPKKAGNYAGAAFMNIVRKKLYFILLDEYPDVEVRYTDGAATKCSRRDLGLNKSHANDAYAMGKFHPVERAETEYYQKRRRNNRVLEKFYDAKYIDNRDGSTKSGKDLSCGRPNRSVPRNNPESLRIYRGRKVKSGKRAVRKCRYSIQPGTLIFVNNKKRIATGVHANGKSVQVQTKGSEQRDYSTSKCKILSYPSGWERIYCKK
ncbi:MAG: HNH endonuclease [Anaerolineaceae bacterium]|nr:HNH endonuclease [Anaerolineaceae bacterium]